MKRIARLFYRDTRGQDLIEYALMLAMIAVVAGAIMPSVGQAIGHVFKRINNGITLNTCLEDARGNQLAIQKCYEPNKK